MDGESPENRLNGDGEKQILAPAEGPRENLISTAVKFLQNPKVMSSPLYQKKAFLEKKGLTQEEINIAIQRSGVKEVAVSSDQALPLGYQPQLNTGSPQLPPGFYAPIPPRSRWAQARDVTMTTVIVAGVSYAVYQLFQTYLRPLLFGKTAEQRRLEKLESQIIKMEKSVVDTLAEITKTLAGIQMALNNQQSQSVIGHGEIKGISDLKADIASLKGLLLNRSQFPPAPSTSPVLPSWQRAQAPAAAAAIPSYAAVVKASTITENEDRSTAQTQESEDSYISNSVEASLLTDSHHDHHQPQGTEEDDHSESQDLSYSKTTDSGSNIS